VKNDNIIKGIEVMATGYIIRCLSVLRDMGTEGYMITERYRLTTLVC